MKPLRRKQNGLVTTDPVTGQERVLEWSEEQHVLSDAGSADSSGVQRVFFRDCGCRAEPAGQCFECGAISCAACHGRCQKCRKPICMEHSRFITDDDGQPVRLCESCYSKVSRKQFGRKVMRLIFAPFIQEEKRHD